MAVGPTRPLQLCCSERRPSRHGAFTIKLTNIHGAITTKLTNSKPPYLEHTSHASIRWLITPQRLHHRI